MRRMLTMLIFVAMAMDIVMSCSDCSTTNHHYYRKRRSAADMQDGLLTVQTVIGDIEDRFRNHVSNRLAVMSVSDRKQFDDDMDKMAIAAQSAYMSVLVDNNGKINSNGEMMKTVVARITESFSDEPWYQRLDSMGHRQIARIIDNTANNLD